MLDKSTGVALKMSGGGCTPEEAMKEHQGIIERVHVPALKVMEAQLTANGGPFIAGNFVSIADCCMVAMLANIWENPAGPLTSQFEPVLKQYPKVQAYNLALREAFKDRLTSSDRPALQF